jgi:hypothetical protein
MSLALFVFAAIACGDLFAAKTKWPAIPAEELAATRSEIEPEAPAELMLMRIDKDDSEYPRIRKSTTYRRYKIYAPDRAEDLIRTVAASRNWTVARLTLPNGKTTEFGERDYLKQTSAAKSGAMTARESWLLAIPGVEPGSILEYQTERGSGTQFSDNSRFESQELQQKDLPVRRFEWTCRHVTDRDIDFRVFLVSAPTAQLTRDDKKHTISVVAENLPAIKNEPHTGPVTDYSASILLSYNSRKIELMGGADLSVKIDRTAGPWAPLATIAYVIDQARAKQTKRVAKLATEITGKATTDLEKARLIHRAVQDLYRKYLTVPLRDRAGQSSPLFAETLDHVLDFAEKSGGPRAEDMDFFWLAVSLFRAAGLETKVILLPNRELARLDKDQVSQIFMNHIAAAVRVDGVWQFSYPLPEQTLDFNNVRTFYSRINARPFLSFGMLPWNLEGQEGLLVQKNKQEFVAVPFTKAAKSMEANGGVFTLDETGTLTGKPTRRLTGHAATSLRGRLLVRDTNGQNVLALELLQADLPEAELSIVKITGIEDPEQPLEIHYELTWPGFATALSDRLLLRPAVFRRGTKPRFPATERRHPVYFRTPWQEVDRVAIRMPAGFAPETTTSPATLQGNVLYYKMRYSFDAAKRVLSADRDFSSDLIDLPVSGYPKLKSWFDGLYAGDQYEIVFLKTHVSPSPAATPTP